MAKSKSAIRWDKKKVKQQLHFEIFYKYTFLNQQGK
jgi:hypothetical protein